MSGEEFLSYKGEIRGSLKDQRLFTKGSSRALFHREEIGFSVKASGVAGEAAVPAYDAVAGDDEGDGISSDGASDGAGG